jgi:hypothetical protein
MEIATAKLIHADPGRRRGRNSCYSVSCRLSLSLFFSLCTTHGLVSRYYIDCKNEDKSARHSINQPQSVALVVACGFAPDIHTQLVDRKLPRSTQSTFLPSPETVLFSTNTILNCLVCVKIGLLPVYSIIHNSIKF